MNVEVTVSVIVTIYNSEKTLLRCLNSLRVQTLHSIEVILVDDGSTDRSAQICDDYGLLDSRFIVIHKANGGVSTARQCGIDHAQGKYTIHVDPDDWVEVTMLEDLYTQAEEANADMVICDYFYNDGKRQIYCKQRPLALDHITVMKELFMHLHGSCCNKLIKRDCYRKYNIKFPLGINCSEDLIFNVRLLVHPIHIVYYPQAYYHYMHDANSNVLTKKYVYGKDSYELDQKITDLLSHDVPSGVYKQYIYPLWMYQIMCKAFKNRTFSSGQFLVHFLPSIKSIFLNPIYPKLKFFLFFSCLGFYKPSYLLYRFLQRIVEKKS